MANRCDIKKLALNIRRYSLMAIHSAKSGHPGGVLSAAELLAVLWGRVMQGNDLPSASGDRFVMSKGHACPGLYAVAAEFGLIKHSELFGLRKLGNPLQGHPSVLHTPWVETSTGSLGQGFSYALGLAMGLRYKSEPGTVYALLGDGELQEGEVWEAAMVAAHHKLDNLCAIIDYNKMQSDALNEEIIGLEPLVDKWKAFGWHVDEVDGHDVDAVVQVTQNRRDLEGCKPHVLIAHTIKGKGVSYMEGSPAWHGSVALKDDELRIALADLGMSRQDIDGYFEREVV